MYFCRGGEWKRYINNPYFLAKKNSQQSSNVVTCRCGCSWQICYLTRAGQYICRRQVPHQQTNDDEAYRWSIVPGIEKPHHDYAFVCVWFAWLKYHDAMVRSKQTKAISASSLARAGAACLANSDFPSRCKAVLEFFERFLLFCNWISMDFQQLPISELIWLAQGCKCHIMPHPALPLVFWAFWSAFTEAWPERSRQRERFLWFSLAKLLTLWIPLLHVAMFPHDSALKVAKEMH